MVTIIITNAFPGTKEDVRNVEEQFLLGSYTPQFLKINSDDSIVPAAPSSKKRKVAKKQKENTNPKKASSTSKQIPKAQKTTDTKKMSTAKKGLCTCYLIVPCMY